MDLAFWKVGVLGGDDSMVECGTSEMAKLHRSEKCRVAHRPYHYCC